MQKLLDEALFLLGGVIDCYNQIVTVEGGRLEKWMVPWAVNFHSSDEQTFSLIRAAYLKVGWFFLQERKRPLTIEEDSPVAISEDVLIREESSEYAREIRLWQAVATVCRHTTEWWDGSGFPGGLAGENIPLESRMLVVIEAFFTELNASGDTEVAMAHLRAGVGSRFDPRVVDAFEIFIDGG